MRRFVVAVSLALVGVGVTPVGAGAAGGRTGTVEAAVDGDRVTLGNNLVRREWKVRNGVVTTAFADPRVRNWSVPASEEFRVVVDGVPLTSTSNWDVLSVKATRAGGSRRPTAGQVTFRLGTPGSAATGVGVEVDRTYTLRAGSAVMEVAATL